MFVFFQPHSREDERGSERDRQRERENGNKNTSFVNRVSIKNEMAKCNLFNV